ncbi:MAG: DNA-binding protein [Lachnospiraceae bacterium]|nr:DNA-binding protein [Lachnospiraceae bacterium]
MIEDVHLTPEDEIDQRLYLVTLFDFYGALLKENQRAAFEGSILEDLSLSEIAEEMEISRQGVHDLVKRTCRQLESYEERLRLVEKFQIIKSKIETLNQRMMTYHNLPEEEAREIQDTLREILEEI